MRLTKPSKNKDIIITKPDKGNGIVILYQKVEENAIQKFEKLNEDPLLKGEASLQLFLSKLKHKTFFNPNEYDNMYPFFSPTARIYDTPKIHKFSSSDSFPELRLILPSISSFN